MKFFVLILFVFTSGSLMAQCTDFYEWGEDNYKKKNYDQAEKYLFKTIENCGGADIKAASWLFLMDIYKNGKPNDSLYLMCKKALVRNKYESPNYKITYIGIDPNIYIPEIPQIDLYPTSRELVCELYEKGEYDSALFYFNNYARNTYAKGWCGVGKENNYLYDQIILARLSAANGDTVLAFKWLDLAPYIDPYEVEQDEYLYIYCFYNNVQTLYPEYRKGDILAELDENLHYGRITNEQVYFCTSFRGRSIYFHEKWIPEMLKTSKDTLHVMDSIFHHTLLYQLVEFREKLQYDSVVTLQGHLSVGTGYVTFFSNHIAFNIEGWDMKDYPAGMIELTGRFTKEKTLSNPWLRYNSELIEPESYKRTLQMISYKSLLR